MCWLHAELNPWADSASMQKVGGMQASHSMSYSGWGKAVGVDCCLSSGRCLWGWERASEQRFVKAAKFFARRSNFRAAAFSYVGPSFFFMSKAGHSAVALLPECALFCV